MCPVRTPNWSQTYAYDGFGNLTAKSAPSGSAEPTFPGVNSANNQLNGVGYDANGNATAYNNFTLTYDMENRMVGAQTGTASETIVYDPANHRIRTTQNNGTDTLWFYGPDGKLLTTFALQMNNGYATSQLHRIYFGGMLLGTTDGITANATYGIQDRLGSGTPVYPYGTDITGAHSYSSTIDFATYMKEGFTGLEYANQRWYGAGFGRFLTADKGNSAVVSRPVSWNRYAYASEDPLNRLDPSGLEDCGADFCVTVTDMPNYIAFTPVFLPGAVWDPVGALIDKYRQLQLQRRAVQNDLLAATNLALAALASSDCKGLFGTAASRSNGWDPATVLTAMMTNSGQSFNGFQVYSMADFWLTTVDAQVNNRIPGIDWVEVNAGTVLSAANDTPYRGAFPYFGMEVNATNLLHELGHVFADAAGHGSGGSALQYDGGDAARSSANGDLVRQKCFPQNP